MHDQGEVPDVLLQRWLLCEWSLLRESSLARIDVVLELVIEDGGVELGESCATSKRKQVRFKCWEDSNARACHACAYVVHKRVLRIVILEREF